MYVSHQGLQAMQQERVNTTLARAERNQLMRQARVAQAERRNQTGAWRGLRRALLGALLIRVGKPTYDPSTVAE